MQVWCNDRYRDVANYDAAADLIARVAANCEQGDTLVFLIRFPEEKRSWCWGGSADMVEALFEDGEALRLWPSKEWHSDEFFKPIMEVFAKFFH